jgi:putative SOS response-associated peptidase YedK
MCTLYRLASRTAEIARLFDASPAVGWNPPLSLYPDRLAPVVRQGPEGRLLAEARWGVPPPAAGARPVVNIRNLESPFWHGALAQSRLRCLVPADSFCEWTDAPDPATGRKRQHFFARADGTPFAFAGLLREGAPGEPPRFAFLTTEPNALVAPIHAKAMPVILGPAEFAPWLDGAPAAAFQHPAPDDLLRLLT